MELEIIALVVKARLDVEGSFQFIWDFSPRGMTSHSSQLIHNCPQSSLLELGRSDQPNATVRNGLLL